jgi:hypothetical protein
MTSGRTVVAAATLCVVAATAGCGLGPGESSPGKVTLTVTQHYGAESLLSASESDPSASETVLRLLDREAEITTRYGGGFIESIDGISGGFHAGRSSDWFFFVNGLESRVGAAEVNVRGGDTIWWDYRDWTDAITTPAVVGSWPEPFAQNSAGIDAAPVEVVCFGPRPPCDQAADRLGDAGVDAQVMPSGQAADTDALRLLVGTWRQVSSDPAAAQIDDGPGVSGVFARFDGASLAALGENPDNTLRLGPDAALVAGVRLRDQPATWVATGGDADAVEAAVGLLDADALRNHYAVVAQGDKITPIPVAAAE